MPPTRWHHHGDPDCQPADCNLHFCPVLQRGPNLPRAARNRADHSRRVFAIRRFSRSRITDLYAIPVIGSMLTISMSSKA